MSWILTHLYKATKDPEHLKKAVEIWRREINSATKLNMFHRAAELYWNVARVQDILKKYLEATKNFEYASANYMKAAEKTQRLKDFYKEYASYMQAWSEFEKAKQYHMEKKYIQAKEHYEKAADIHKSTDRWNYLAPNYLAWARLEEAEDLSRREQTKEAINLFQEAKNLFEETKRAIELKQKTSQDVNERILRACEAPDLSELVKQAREATGSEEIELSIFQDDEEDELLVSLTQGSDIRRDYCLGRIDLEEAKTLDRLSDNIASSRRFGAAADKFQRMAETSKEASEELGSLVCLCRAWQKMTQAEAEASPDLYLEASQLFEETQNQSTDEKSKRLALGHSYFCRALNAGTRFEVTRDPELYSEAIRYLENAASFYLRAGFKNASEYAKATQRLLDAYIHMDNASKEIDPQNKAKYYLMVEKLLESSAQSYMISKYPEKSKEVERLLEKIREEREMAASLSELLHASTVTSSTEAFISPLPTREEAIGVERFEDANIYVNLVLLKEEARIGEDVHFEIELTNIGRKSAQLIRVEDFIPEGFDVKNPPDRYRVEGTYLNMKGKMLSPLEMEEVKLILKPRKKGTFKLKPSILYIGETGNCQSFEPEPITITIKELGISGWLRGPNP